MGDYRAAAADFLTVVPVYRGRFAPKFAYAKAALERVTLTLAFSHKGLTGGTSERGRPARNPALARGVTLTLALSHKGLATRHFLRGV